MSPVVARIVTCSYRAYRREFGTAVRITLGVPRWIRLPNPAYTERESWLSVPQLAPRRDYFRAADDVFNTRYLDQLERLADEVDQALDAIPPEHGAICLCCFEQQVTGPGMCHRRLASAWLAERYCIEIPEMDPAPTGCK